MKFGLSQEQLKVVLSESPRKGVIAGAGSGKTATLVELAVQSVSNGLRPLIFTLTNAAADEIRARLAAYVASEPGGVSDDWLNRVPHVTTVHAYAYGLVCEHQNSLGFTGNPTIPSDDDLIQLATRIVGDAGLKLGARDIKNLVSKGLEHGGAWWGGKLESVMSCLSLMDNLLKEQNCARYERIIQLAAYVLFDLRTSACCREQNRFGCIIVDEAQDIDAGLWLILDALRIPNITVFGDPNQAIFGFRGGNAEKFVKFAQEQEQFTLATNYRSRSEILDVANKIAPDKSLQMQSFHGTGGSVAALSGDQTASEDAVVEMARAAIELNQQLAILTRTNNVADAWNGFLVSCGIAPEKVRVNRNVKGKDPATEALRSYYRLAVNPWDEMAFRALMLAMEKSKEWIEEMITSSRVRRTAPGRLLCVTNLDPDDICFDENAKIADFKNTGKGTIDDYLALAAAGEFDEKFEGGQIANITISTVHRAKGLEWDTVVLDLNSFFGKECTEELCLLYVAITRARTEFYYMYSPETECWRSRLLDAALNGGQK